MLEQSAEGLFNKAVELAMAGNIAALRLCLEPLLPTHRNEPLFCQMPPLAKAADAVAAIAGIASAALVGDVTADEAAKLTKVMSLYVKALEANEFEDRLALLERTDLKRMGEVGNGAPISRRTTTTSSFAGSGDRDVGSMNHGHFPVISLLFPCSSLFRILPFRQMSLMVLTFLQILAVSPPPLQGFTGGGGSQWHLCQTTPT